MTQSQAGSPPAPLAGAAVLVAVEALALVVLAGLELASLDARRLALGLTTSLFFLLLGGGLAVCAWGLARVRSWSRGPVVAAQLIGVLLAYSFWGGATTAVAIVLAAVTLLALGGVLHPASTRALASAET